MLTSILGGIAFFVLIIASVLLHELGHLVPAKLFGVKVTQYFAGFGPTLWSRKVGETEYGLKAIPFGGFVQLEGMLPPRHPDAKDTWLQRVADGVRDLESVDPADEGRLFYQKPVWQKLIIMTGGVFTNLVIAFLLFWAVLGTLGHAVQTTTVRSVEQCVLADATARTCRESDPRTPAATAGLRAGDRIVAFNGVETNEYRRLSELIRANADHDARVTVERDGARVDLPVVKTMVHDAVDRLDPSRTVRVGFLGFSPRVEVVREGPAGTAAQMWEMSQSSLVALVQLPVKTYNVVADMVRGRPRDVTSPMSIVGASVVAGDVAASHELTLGEKAAVGASLLGGLNLFLFWFNLVPLPPMDGGHAAGALWDGLRRLAARLLGRPDPGHVDTAKMMPVSYVVGGALLVMGVVLILADIISPVRIF